MFVVGSSEVQLSSSGRVTRIWFVCNGDINGKEDDLSMVAMMGTEVNCDKISCSIQGIAQGPMTSETAT